MRKIDKQITNEPQSLVAYRSTPGASYDDLEKSNLQDALLDEQLHLCAYCMKRIGTKGVYIEHFLPRTKYKKLELTYSNLLGVCDGGKKAKTKDKQLHCDTKKANDLLLKLNPLDDSFKSLTYEKDGTVISNDDDVKKDIVLLGLNEGLFLRENRANVIKSLQSEYRQLLGKSLNEKNTFLRTKLKFFQEGNQGKLPEYCQVAINWLEKKL